MKLAMARLAFVCTGLLFIGLLTGMIAKNGHAAVVGIWLLDEGKGKVAEDFSGNGHDGQLEGNPKWVEGKFGKALEFDGTNVVKIEHADAFDLTTFTLQAWIKLKKGGAWQQIVIKSGNPRPFSLGVSPVDHIECAFRGKAGWINPRSTSAVVDSKWHHVAGTYDKKKMRIYVDGVLETERPSNENPPFNKIAVQIGGVGGERIIGGIIDEVLIFDTALTGAEIKGWMEGAATVEPSGKLATTWGSVKGKHKR